MANFSKTALILAAGAAVATQTRGLVQGMTVDELRLQAEKQRVAQIEANRLRAEEVRRFHNAQAAKKDISINRHTGEPHKNARAIARQLKRMNKVRP